MVPRALCFVSSRMILLRYGPWQGALVNMVRRSSEGDDVKQVANGWGH